MVNNHLAPVITIDGVGSVGKGTLSLMLAKKLRWHFLDSGVIYRALALSVQKNNISEKDEPALAAKALNLDLYFSADAKIILENLEVTDDIPTPECGNLASRIS